MMVANSQWLVLSICCTCNGNNPTVSCSAGKTPTGVQYPDGDLYGHRPFWQVFAATNGELLKTQNEILKKQ